MLSQKPETTEDQKSVDTKASLEAQIWDKNLADKLDEKILNDIGQRCKAGYEQDVLSRSDWEADMEEWTRLAMQVRETKTFPWPRASNVKYPLLSTAAMQFAARAYPSLVPSDGKVVKSKVVGKDPTDAKRARAERVSMFMSWQIMDDMDGWDEDMDKMLMMLPIVGTMFKKTYWSVSDKKICSRLVMPKNLVVNYWAKDLSTAERVSEIIQLSPRLVEQRKREGLFLDIDLGDAPTPATADAPSNDETTPYTFIEQHTFYDLDEDGYEEPYVVTFQRESGKVVRISARYEIDNVVLDKEGKNIVKISPTVHYTKFGFVPNPDGSFYDIGFGILLGPLNESVNTLINQLVDSGSLSNLQSGFIGKGLRIKMGDTKFSPGEWKPVNSTGDDLRKQIVPLPAKEPSNVLFQLMGTMITSGKELASVAEIFVGKMPGQNTPATTTMASIEQGMKVFTAVYKRLYRSLKEEFAKIYKLNKVYLDPNTESEVLDVPIGPDDFAAEGKDILPGADPTAISQTEKLVKAQGLMELLSMAGPMLNPVKVISRVLEAQEQPNWQELFSDEVIKTGQVPQQPNPKLMEMQMKSQAEQQKFAMQAQVADHKMELDSRSKEQQLAMEAEQHSMEMQAKQMDIMTRAAEAEHKQKIFTVAEMQKAHASEQQHQQKMRHSEEQNKFKTSQARATSKSGKPTR